MSELRLCCPIVWDAVKACNAFGAPSSHGCGFEPGHVGDHRCPCGSVSAADGEPT